MMKLPAEDEWSVGLPAAVRAYLADVVRVDAAGDGVLISIILFGSAAAGGYSTRVSDVDLFLVVRDDATHLQRQRLQQAVADMEAAHGLRDAATEVGRLESLMLRLTANVRSFFTCSRSDLLSGDVARILGISRTQARFVDRGVIPNIVRSGRTVWGEELLPRVPLAPIRRRDVLKSLYSFCNQGLLAAAAYPFVPHATKYSMSTLKRAVHSCYFCYTLDRRSLDEEIAFLARRHGPSTTLQRLLQLRAEYTASPAFILRCLPTLVSLHVRTILDNDFPRHPRATDAAGAALSQAERR